MKRITKKFKKSLKKKLNQRGGGGDRDEDEFFYWAGGPLYEMFRKIDNFFVKNHGKTASDRTVKKELGKLILEFQPFFRLYIILRNEYKWSQKGADFCNYLRSRILRYHAELCILYKFKDLKINDVARDIELDGKYMYPHSLIEDKTKLKMFKGLPSFTDLSKLDEVGKLIQQELFDKKAKVLPTIKEYADKRGPSTVDSIFRNMQNLYNTTISASYNFLSNFGTLVSSLLPVAASIQESSAVSSSSSIAGRTLISAHGAAGGGGAAGGLSASGSGASASGSGASASGSGASIVPDDKIISEVSKRIGSAEFDLDDEDYNPYLKEQMKGINLDQLDDGKADDISEML
ncbi:MAG: hypothetical protein EBQ92_12785 [Proteobacteria bacterium]|nr:hypothetical protein [Pseudomonadota bacterium]